MATNEVVECIRPLLARFSENEETVRRLVATDGTFDALCHQYRRVVDLLKAFEAEADHDEAEIERLERRRAGLEEELLIRIEGYQPQ